MRRGEIRRSGEFLWRSDLQEAPLSERSGLPDASKKLEFIAPEEIAAAIEKVVAGTFGMVRTEIPSAVLSLLLGFKRTTGATQQQVIKVLDDMIAEEKLVEEGSYILLKS